MVENEGLLIFLWELRRISFDVTSLPGNCCHFPAKRGEQEEHSRDRRGRWKEGVNVRLCLPTQGHPAQFHTDLIQLVQTPVQTLTWGSGRFISANRIRKGLS